MAALWKDQKQLNHRHRNKSEHDLLLQLALKRFAVHSTDEDNLPKVIDQGDENILSQKVPKAQNDDSKVLLDLSTPLAAHTTSTSIPQIDDQVDLEDSVDGCIKKLPKNRSMPILSTSDFGWNFDPLPKPKGEHNEELEQIKPKPPKFLVKRARLNTGKLLTNAKKASKTKAYKRRSPEEKLNEILRLIRYRIKKFNKKRKIKIIGKILRKHDNRTRRLLEKTTKPKFRTLPGKKWFLAPRFRPEDINNTTVSHLINLTRNYTYTDLRVLIKTPSKAYFLYYDGGPILNFVSIPKNAKRRYRYYKSLVEGSRMNRFNQQKLTMLQNKILKIKPKQENQQITRTDETVVSNSDSNNNKQIVSRFNINECKQDKKVVASSDDNKQEKTVVPRCENKNKEVILSCDSKKNNSLVESSQINSIKQKKISILENRILKLPWKIPKLGNQQIGKVTKSNETVLSSSYYNNNNKQDDLPKKIKTCQAESQSHSDLNINKEINISDLKRTRPESHRNECDIQDASIMSTFEPKAVRSISSQSKDSYIFKKPFKPSFKPKHSNILCEIDNLAEKLALKLKITDTSKRNRLKNVGNCRRSGVEHDISSNCRLGRTSIDKLRDTSRRHCDKEERPKIKIRKRLGSYTPSGMMVTNSPSVQGNYQSDNLRDTSRRRCEKEERPKIELSRKREGSYTPSRIMVTNSRSDQGNYFDTSRRHCDRIMDSITDKEEQRPKIKHSRKPEGSYTPSGIMATNPPSDQGNDQSDKLLDTSIMDSIPIPKAQGPVVKLRIFKFGAEREGSYTPSEIMVTNSPSVQEYYQSDKLPDTIRRHCDKKERPEIEHSRNREASYTPSRIMVTNSPSDQENYFDTSRRHCDRLMDSITDKEEQRPIQIRRKREGSYTPSEIMVTNSSSVQEYYQSDKVRDTSRRRCEKEERPKIELSRKREGSYIPSRIMVTNSRSDQGNYFDPSRRHCDRIMDSITDKEEQRPKIKHSRKREGSYTPSRIMVTNSPSVQEYYQSDKLRDTSRRRCEREERPNIELSRKREGSYTPSRISVQEYYQSDKLRDTSRRRCEKEERPKIELRKQEGSYTPSRIMVTNSRSDQGNYFDTSRRHCEREERPNIELSRKREGSYTPSRIMVTNSRSEQGNYFDTSRRHCDRIMDSITDKEEQRPKIKYSRKPEGSYTPSGIMVTNSPSVQEYYQSDKLRDTSRRRCEKEERPKIELRKREGSYTPSRIMVTNSRSDQGNYFDTSRRHCEREERPNIELSRKREGSYTPSRIMVTNSRSEQGNYFDTSRRHCDRIMDSITDKEEQQPKIEYSRKREGSYTPSGIMVTNSPSVQEYYQSDKLRDTSRRRCEKEERPKIELRKREGSYTPSRIMVTNSRSEQGNYFDTSRRHCDRIMDSITDKEEQRPIIKHSRNREGSYTPSGIMATNPPSDQGNDQSDKLRDTSRRHCDKEERPKIIHRRKREGSYTPSGRMVTNSPSVKGNYFDTSSRHCDRIMNSITADKEEQPPIKIRRKREGSYTPSEIMVTNSSSVQEYYQSASPQTNFGFNMEPDDVLLTYVPTPEEEAFSKRVFNSPRRISKQNEVSFNIEKFVKEEPGPSSVITNNMNELLDTSRRHCDRIKDSVTDKEEQRPIKLGRVGAYTPSRIMVTNSPSVQEYYQSGPSENTVEISGNNKEEELLVPREPASSNPSIRID